MKIRKINILVTNCGTSLVNVVKVSFSRLKIVLKLEDWVSRFLMVLNFDISFSDRTLYEFINFHSYDITEMKSGRHM